MNPKRGKRRRKAVQHQQGPLIPDRECEPASEAELDEVARVTPDQEERAREAARRHGSARFLEMLDAEPDPEIAEGLRELASDDRGSGTLPRKR